MKSRKTTVAGLLAALGLILTALSKMFGEGGEGWEGLPQVAPELLGALGAALLGLFARDDNVTSEGTKAPKSPPGFVEPEPDDDGAYPSDLD